MEAHERTTGPELVRGMEGDLDVVVSGVGTGGTLMGIARALDAAGVSAELVLADPSGSVLSGAVAGLPTTARPYLIEGIGGDFVPSLFDEERVRHAVPVPDSESVAAFLWLQREEGLFLGGSSGCAVTAAVRFLRGLEGPPRNVVVMLPDSGFRYLSTIYSPAWRRSRAVDAPLPAMVAP